MHARSGIVITITLGALLLFLFYKAREAFNAEVPDATRVIGLFGGIVVVGLVAGITFVVTCMPGIAEWFGNLFFNPDEEIERSPHVDALAAVQKGDYAGAVKAFKEAWEADHGDEMALEQINMLCCEKLDDPEAAAAFYQVALSQDLTEEEAANVRLQLANVYARRLAEPARARELLVQITEEMPNTRYAAKARIQLEGLSV
jgi:tetratricopeptide (TPR) repeat protein